MKKLIMMILICSIFFTGCSEIISEERLDIAVTVTDSHYSGAWTSIIPVGDIYVTTYYDAEYYIYLTYEGKEYSINDEDTYNKYKDKVGEDVKATLVVEKYDNTTTKSKIILE